MPIRRPQAPRARPTYPDRTTVTNAYDGPGNLITVTDQAGNMVQYTYDAANQLKTVVQVNSPKHQQQHQPLRLRHRRQPHRPDR